MADSQANDNNTCVVCFKNVLYYSIGECDHPVCFECSTRMRVLCVQNECPICRQELSRVVFTETVKPYKELCTRVFSDRLFERQYKIWFCSQEIKNAYERLLENRCKVCDNQPPFRAFSMLSEHMRKVHERYFCDLCVKHLKIFTSERKCYTRQELAHHRRKGDLDDTSHRGHPLCEFCEERFMDADELYRHLRKEHLYCHLCDADGRNLYYATHASLAQHFRADHYLCEEGECAGQHLTAVFRSEIDLKAHKATVHGRGLARGAARQARTLELQFNITPHPGVQRAPRDRDRDRDRERERDRDRERERDREHVETASPPPAAAPHIDTHSDEQFPRLSSAPAAPTLMMSAPSRAYRGSEGLARNDKNFPALDGGGGSGGGAGSGAGSGSSSGPARSAQPHRTVAATLLRNSKPSVSIQLHSQPASASNFRLTPAPGGGRVTVPARRPPADDDFPALGPALAVRDDRPSLGAATPQPPKVASINSQEMNALSRPQNSNSSAHTKKAQLSSEAFPALSATTAPAAPPQWITVSKPKEKLKPAKQEPPPQPREPTFNPVADFPTLPVNNSKPKPKKVAQPPPTPAYSTPPNDAKPKKEKKKQNNNAKKENIAEIPYVNGVVDRKIAKELSYGASVNNNLEDKKIKTAESASADDKNKNGGNGDFALTSKDYPPLNPRSENTSTVAPAPKDYSALRENTSSKKVPNGTVPPPPGFKSRPACDGMTFTNSAGQTFPAPVHTYIPPPDFEQRNRALVKKFAVALGGAAAVEDFKVASRAFRDSVISADEFYAQCRAAVGPQLDAVFPELVALLPDIGKQQELVVGRPVGALLHVCGTCGQLLAPPDRPAHDTAHWPPLK